MAVRPSPMSLDALRATLGCIQLSIQARAALNALPYGEGWAVLLGKDWGFATALACHIVWLISSTFGARLSGPFCCASRVAPKVSLLAQLVAQRAVPPTAAWLNEAWDQRYKVCWKAMAEVCVYTCGEFASSMVLLVAAFEAVCTVAIWARVRFLGAMYPALSAAAAHVLFRVSLSFCVHYCQRSATFGWARNLFSAWWRQPYEEQRATKDDPVYDILRAHTPVYSSILCCSNPTILSHIAAASSKDLEPVRLERLSTYSVADGATADGQLSRTKTEAASCGAGIQAYDLARRLVSSAGASGGAGGSSYTSAARKVRVSVKIPDRSPEDLPPGWDAGVQINSQRRAVVLFTYIRRGCIQLVIDLFVPVPAPMMRGEVATALDAVPASRAETNAETPEVRCTSEKTSPTDSTGRVASLNGVSSESRVHTSLVSGIQAPKAGSVNRRTEQSMRTAFSVGGELAEQAGMAVASVPCSASCDAHTQLLRAVCSDSLFAGRTLTLQVGATASLIRVQPGEPDKSSGTSAVGMGPGGQHALVVREPPLGLPPNVRVSQHVVCTGIGLAALRFRQRRPERRREVVLACSWGTDADCIEPPASCTRASISGQPPLPNSELQLTVRQQGRFLPVALFRADEGKSRRAQRRLLGTAMVAGNVAGTAEPSSSKAASVVAAAGMPETLKDGMPPPPVGGVTPRGPPTRLLAFVPSSADGLVEVELSCKGMHSATAASVLLVSSPAIAFELEQLQAAAGGGLDLGAATRPSMVLDVIRDFGMFLDIVPALFGGDEGAGTADAVGSWSQPMIEWSLAPVGNEGFSVPVPTRVVFLRPGSRCNSRCSSDSPQPQKPVFASAEGDMNAGAEVGIKSNGGDHSTAADGLEEYRQQRALNLASVGCRLGLNLLRYFLSTGMAACATRVLDVLHRQLGVPASLLAGPECCHERMTLLHHASRSGSFRTLAAVVTWLEEHGMDPGWDDLGPSGLTPLHLLAVVPDNELATTLVQLRWPSARITWHGCKAGNATPAQFASLAWSGNAALVPPLWWQRAADSTLISWAVGGAWRYLIWMRRLLVPRRVSRACRDIVAPARGFMLKSLELSYEEWLLRRVAFMDHLFLALYTAQLVTQAVKGGWTFFFEHVASIFLLATRLGLLVLHSPLRAVMYPRLVSLGRRWAGQLGNGASKESGTVVGSRRAWLLASREGTASLLELLRLTVMLLVAASVFPMPYSWVRLVQLRLDFIINPLMRPTAGQMRLLPSFIAAIIALMAETSITTVVFWKPGMWVAWTLVLAFARGAVTHGLGLVLTILLQTSARGRFLSEMRILSRGRLGNK
ncbi:hypothetical protein Vretimale_4710 [Volvox reticuliferus]|uniref:Uncharacterized protein n=1 Tax=Volvox reticuliferus TaxID=1737510 RepID=A0A8J4G4F6_9CHLO|nr:hypothetical protein Vretifemale_3313 [Volvox reticuliferus]GIL99574.1 hypothetical protein Vretimale_4710 [Volvox reticuliferus]